LINREKRRAEIDNFTERFVKVTSILKILMNNYIFKG